MLSKICALFLMTSFFLIPAYSYSNNRVSSGREENCGLSPHPCRLEIRHIEANGVGYNQGYTTLEGFFTLPQFLDKSLVPFLDLRGHIFNDGKPALNTGLGLRYAESRAWGINAYYDYRKTHKTHYNQVSVGLETLGKMWDFRINGYLPVGDKTSHFYDTKFHRFKGNHLVISQKQEFAMKGLNAEAGVHVLEKNNYDLYLAAGPFYFQQGNKNAIGGEMRISSHVTDYVRLQVNSSYDTLFHGIIQGEVSVIYPFGGRKQIKKNRSCDHQIAIGKRVLQRVDRNEIIVVDKRHKHSKAINPNTGDPFVFWFVDNTSSSNGTFESPFSTLLAAQNSSNVNDVIYVFPGNGTDSGMNRGIVLKDNQRLFGAGINHVLDTTKGRITIPRFASTAPLISDSTGSVNSAVVSLADNCEVSGMNIHAKQTLGIFGINIDSGFIHHNNVNVDIPATSGTGIGISNYSGSINITDNIVSGTNIEFSLGISVTTPVSASSTGFIANNTVSNASLAGITAVQFFPGVAAHVIIKENTISNCQQGVRIFNVISGTGLNVDIIENTILGQTDYGGFDPGAGVFVSNFFNVVGPLCLNIRSNTTVSPAGFTGFIFENSSATPTLMNLSIFDDNVGTVSLTANPIFTGPCP